MNSGLIKAVSQRDVLVKRCDKRWMHLKGPLYVMMVSAAVSLLASCTLNEGSSQVSLGGDGLAANGSQSGKMVQRDIEAPEVFQLTGAGVWDGRPTLGGVWVAHSSARSAERVIIRSGQNGKFVIGALFRRDPVKVGPRIQMSADAAQALGAAAGQPVNLDITALRPHESAASSAKVGQSSSQETLKKAPTILKKDGVAMENSKLQKPFIQLGIFNLQQNAKNTATSMRQLGIVPLVKQQSKDGKPFWRVLVGPASSLTERARLLEKVRSVGFQDAYAVTH